MSERPPEARYNPLWELTLSRAREFVREPEAVFWVFVFPVLLALALGIAFRSQPTDAYRVAVTGPPDASGWAASRLEADRGFAVSQMSPPEAARALAAGKVDAVVVAPDGLGSPTASTRRGPRGARRASPPKTPSSAHSAAKTPPPRSNSASRNPARATSIFSSPA
jgi:hypothetical protein